MPMNLLLPTMMEAGTLKEKEYPQQMNLPHLLLIRMIMNLSPHPIGSSTLTVTAVMSSVIMGQTFHKFLSMVLV